MSFKAKKVDRVGDHTWSDLQRSLEVFFGVSAGDRNDAAAEICIRAVRSARKVLASMQLPGAAHEADDVAQSLIEKMLRRNLRGYDPAKGSLHAYWYSALRRLCVDAIRQAARHQMHALSMDLAGRQQRPLAIAEQRELQREVRAAVGQLPKQERVLLKLSYRRGRSAVAIGERCRLRPSTVSFRTYQARGKLHASLASTFRSHCGGARLR